MDPASPGQRPLPDTGLLSTSLISLGPDPRLQPNHTRPDPGPTTKDGGIYNGSKGGGEGVLGLSTDISNFPDGDSLDLQSYNCN